MNCIVIAMLRKEGRCANNMCWDP